MERYVNAGLDLVPLDEITQQIADLGFNCIRYPFSLELFYKDPIVQTEAIAANPEAATKIREGKVQVIGVIVGAVMKTTGGSADAAKVRELVLKTLGQ